MEGLPAGYRPNVGVCLINHDNMIFVASRLNVPGAWQMPQGGIEEGEDPRSAAIRELREETGVVSAEIIDEVQEWLSYDFPPAVQAKVNRLWRGQFCGQAQKCLIRLRNTDHENIYIPSKKYKFRKKQTLSLYIVDADIENSGIHLAFERLNQLAGLHVDFANLADDGNLKELHFIIHLACADCDVMHKFLMRFTADESEINLASGETEPEFCEWKWATPEQVIQQAVDYKRPTYEQVMKTFHPYLTAPKATKCYSSKW